MSVFLSPVGGAGAQFFDANGDPLSGGKLYTYSAGTTTPAVTYTSSAGNTANSNPIVLDSAGRVSGSSEIWLTADTNYKFVLKDSNDVLQATWDNIPGINDTSALDAFKAELADDTDAALGDNLVGFRQSDSSGLLTGSVGKTVHDKLQEVVTAKDFGAVGDGVTDDGPALRTAIAAVAGTGIALDLGGYTYLVSTSETPLGWEVASPGIRLPDADITIFGNGYTLQSGTSRTLLCMIQTTYGSTAKINVSGGKVRGTGDTGQSSYGLIDGIVVNGETTNAVFDMEEIDNTKRHGYFIVDGATNNICKARRISNTNRQMLGCGVQIEGSSDNYVYVDTMYQIGANGVDINSFTASLYYPSGGSSPYNATNSSSANKVFVNSIDGTGVNNNTATGDYNGDDDYYGVNVIASTTTNNYIQVGEIKSVRVSSGTIAPALSTYAAAVRLGLGCTNTTVLVGHVSIVGPSDSGTLIKADLCSGCFVQISSADFYTNVLSTPVADSQNNRFIVQDVQGSIAPESLRGLDFRFLQASTCTTTLNGVISGWDGDFGLTFAQLTGRLQITVDTSTFKKIYKQLVFTYPYVMLNFEYFCNNVAGSNPTAGLDEAPFATLALTKNSQWNKTSVVVPYTDGVQTFAFSPNNSGTAASGQYLEIRNVSITLPDGTTLGDNETTGLLVGAPGIGTHTANQRVQNYAPAVGQPKAWVCTVGGTPGTWVSEGNL